MDILQTRSLVKRFGGLTAVGGVSLTVREGEILGLVGPNGAGKSVLFNCVAGTLRPTNGEVLFCGQDTTGFSPERMCRLGLSRTFQIPQPFTGLSAIESVTVSATFSGRLAKGEQPRNVAKSCIDFVGFGWSPETSVSGLNAVDLKRLDLARAIASRPRLVLLDELAAGLMTGQLAELSEIILAMRERGITIVLVEHVIKTVLALCDRLVVLHHGEKIADGPTNEVVRDERVVEAYLGSQAGA
jgi:branched-chain amino acid transport system ATP-binding protein